MDKTEFLDQIKGKLIVSCQALEDEPLHGSDVMAKMAIAAETGGAVAIRANGKEDIAAIQKVTNLPIIGLVKRVYDDSEVYITPTKKEIDELLTVNVDVVAIDMTNRPRPNNESLADLMKYMKENNQLVLADVSTLDEGLEAVRLGADFISTTLSGYTNYTNSNSNGPDITLVEQLVKATDVPVLAEGRIQTPQQAKEVINKGAFSVVVGSIITRPQYITKLFADELNN
ncbi:putative N-acetylmannosamine-6-phosphate 2-epimerase [Ornithinibacillus halotolerans]|uniref:Putative N-acetylmannosamine-6-phosphate 2-epimerase n=2 Tax=Ornithinibacillus halotolerans TaxID=1274357 RepID=A0A916S0U0_9BACI|nr:putative N-acetylmannosamine-6-phosphate 2-epimerase [Ornithinibacillus halotolerans]